MLLSPLAGLALTGPAHAIITRDDVPDDAYIVPDADYPELVDLFGPGDCIGTVIHPSWLLTVAHCAEDLDVGTVLTVGGVDHAAAEVRLHPDWSGWLHDIALIELDPPTDVAPAALYRGDDEEGATLTLFGRGLHGTGLEGERGATDDGQLRRATNVVTRAGPQWLQVYFDAPGDPGVTELEGVGAAGDSGGPAFLGDGASRAIAGLNSWGDAVPYADLAKYGAWDYSTRVSQFVDWVDAEAGTAPEPPPPHDPRTGGCGCASGSVGAAPAAVLAALASTRRRRRARPGREHPTAQ